MGQSQAKGGKKIQVIVADDHQMFRELFRAFVAEETDIEIVAEAGSGAETIAILEQKKPDILILDIDLGDMNGIDVARQVRKTHPAVCIVALTAHVERVYIEQMLKVGVSGYVAKSSGTAQLITAIREVAKGGDFISHEASKVLFRKFRATTDATAPPSSVLGKREKEILGQIANGRRSVEIAEYLGIALGTVEAHRRNIKRKLGIYSTADLVRYAMHQGLVRL